MGNQIIISISREYGSEGHTIAKQIAKDLGLPFYDRNMLDEIAKEKGIPFKAIHLQSKEQAQSAPTPITTYALFYNGKYLTNEQMNDKRFLKLLAK